MVDCLLVTKPGFEWISNVPYFVPVAGLIFGARRWRRWKGADKIVYVIALLGVFIVVWVLTFIFTPRECAAY